MGDFLRCLAFTLAAEGGFSNNPADPGNWTGGQVGAGQLRGTKCGISAASYPQLDIETLSDAEIQDLYQRDYFLPLGGGDLPQPVAMVGFDGAVNAGLRRSIVWLQQAVGQVPDGVLGTRTRQALATADAATVAREALVRRLDFYARSPGWASFGQGWARRVLALAQAIMG